MSTGKILLIVGGVIAAGLVWKLIAKEAVKRAKDTPVGDAADNANTAETWSTNLGIDGGGA